MSKDWSKLAENFDDLQRYITGEATDTQIKKELETLKDLGDVLELACGIGNYTKNLSPQSKSILATDISEEMVRVAKEKLNSYANIKVKKADCYKTGLKSRGYNTIFMANLIHVASEPEEVLKESYRLLKNKGRLVIVSFTADGMSFINKLIMIYRYLRAFGPPPKGGTPFSLKTLTEAVNNNGFKVKEAKLLGDKQSKAMFIVARKSE